MRNYVKQPEDKMKYLKANFQNLNNRSKRDMFFKM